MAKQAFYVSTQRLESRERIVINLRMHYANRSADDWPKLMANLPLSESRDVFLWKQMEIMISRMRSMP